MYVGCVRQVVQSGSLQSLVFRFKKRRMHSLKIRLGGFLNMQVPCQLKNKHVRLKNAGFVGENQNVSAETQRFGAENFKMFQRFRR